MFLNLNVFLWEKKKKRYFFSPQETLLSIPNIWELWISPMVCRGGAQRLFGYSQSWSSIQAEQRRMSQLSVRMGYSVAGRTVGIKLSWIRQVCSTISPCLTKEMFHGSHNRGSLIECVIPMNSDYIYTKKAPGNLILKKKPNPPLIVSSNVLQQMQTPISQPQRPHPVSSEVPALLWVLPITSPVSDSTNPPLTLLLPVTGWSTCTG